MSLSGSAAMVAFKGYFSVALLVLLVQLRPLVAYDKGFNMLYTSNRGEVTDMPITFEKSLPSWMNGTLYHNGLGVFENGNRKVRHFFDSFAKMNSLKLKGGTDKALFTTTFVRTGYFNESEQVKDIAPYMLFAQPDPEFPKDLFLTQVMHGQDNTNVNLFWMGQDLVAIGDFPRVYTIENKGLKTLQRIDPIIHANPKVQTSTRHLSTSHPVPEHGKDTWINIITVNDPLTGTARLHIVRTKSAEEREPIAAIDFEETPYMHSFATTKEHVIVFVNPVHLDFIKMMVEGEPCKGLAWKKDTNTSVFVVEIATGQVRQMETIPFFGLHFVNAFVQADNTIAVDVSTYPDSKVMNQQLLEILMDPVRRDSISPEHCRLKRFVIDLREMSVKDEELPINPLAPAASRLDFPVFNENFRFEKSCYIYGVTQKADGVRFAKWTLSKKDTCDYTNDKLWYRENHYPGEPWFVPRPGAEKEDDGFLMSLILDGEAARTYLAIFDAQTMTIINRAYLPTHLPMTLHGRYHPEI